MTIEEFNSLNEESKRIIIFEADKISEWRNDMTKCQLFSVHNFFIETKTNLRYNSKRTISTYTAHNLPVMYAGIVKSNFYNIHS